MDSAPEDAKLIRLAREVNDAKPDWVIRKVERAIEELSASGVDSTDIRIACLGITFKPDIDDLRESPALQITQILAERYAGQVRVVEPNLEGLPDGLKDMQVALITLSEALVDAHILILLVDHADFRSARPDFDGRQKLIDTRGIWKDTK